jgi:hypothetical protein
VGTRDREAVNAIEARRVDRGSGTERRRGATIRAAVDDQRLTAAGAGWCIESGGTDDDVVDPVTVDVGRARDRVAEQLVVL